MKKWGATPFGCCFRFLMQFSTANNSGLFKISRINFVLIILGSLFFSQTTYGQGIYLGFNSALSDINLKSISGKERYPGFITGTGYKIYAGKKFNAYMSAEVFYASSKDSKSYKVGELTGAGGDILNFLDDVVFFGLLDPGIYATVNTNVNYYGVNAKFSKRFNRKLSLYLKAGISQWESEVDISVSNQPTVTDSDSGTGLNYGTGLKLHFNEKILMYFEYERYNFDDIEITMMGIGVGFLFR